MSQHGQFERLPHSSPYDEDLIAKDSSRFDMHSADTGFSSVPYDAGKNDVFQEQQPHQQYPQPPPTRRANHHVFRFWSWEVLSVFIAVGIVAATIAILSHYEGQKLPDWPFSINLNTLIALLSVILRSALLLTVAEIISQAKWTWFSRPRPLAQLQSFEDASRSVTGSFKLLFVAPTNMLAFIAALITILSLAIGPFTQQAVKTVACPQQLAEMNASLPIAQFVPGSSSYYRIAAGIWDVLVDMKGTMVNGLVDPKGNDTAIVPTCQTGNCTFPSIRGISHSSIAMCSSCIDTTSFVTRNDSSYNYTLPTGLWMSPISSGAYVNVKSADNLSWATTAFTDEFRAAAAASLTNVTVLALTNAPCYNNTAGVLTCPHNVTGYGSVADYVATSCALYPCLKNYFGEVTGGVLREIVVSSEPALINRVEAGNYDNPSSIVVYANYTALKSPCWVDRQMYDKTNLSLVPQIPGRTFTGIMVGGVNYTAPQECLYKLNWIYGSAIKMFMDGTLLKGYCTYDSRQGGELWCGSGNTWWLSPLYNKRMASVESISIAMEQFTAALTNHFRKTGGTNYMATEKLTVQGEVMEMTVCTSFDWRWLVLPVILVAATAALLALIIMQNYRDPRQPVWKSSLLPFLFYGFSHTPESLGPRPVMNTDELYGRGAHITAVLKNGHDAGFVDVTSTELRPRKRRDIDVDSLYHGS